MCHYACVAVDYHRMFNRLCSCSGGRVSSTLAVMCYSRNVSVNLLWLEKRTWMSIYIIQCFLQRL